MTLNEKFCEIAHSCLGSSVTRFEQNACPDQSVGKIENLEHAKDFPYRKPATERSNSPCVLLVMESPHIQEFKGEAGPAKGPTGTQIRKNLAEILRNLNLPLSAELILINAIQHQCSLGVSTKKYRDKVFLKFWNEGAKNDFQARLKQVYKRGDSLLNCCTMGGGASGLRNLVTESIYNALGAVPLRSGNHPYSWCHPRNRNFLCINSGESPHTISPNKSILLSLRK